MTVKEYLLSQDKDTAKIFSEIRKIILGSDKKVTEKVGSIMSSKTALVYLQEDVFKYGLTVNKNFYTFHSMVMYMNPEMQKFVKENFTKAKLQKSCINFKSFDELPLAKLKKLVAASAKVDYSFIINHYKSKKR